jgi:hypothetical protein
MTFDHKQRFGIGMGVKAFPPFLLDRLLTDCRDAVGSYPIISDSGEPVMKRARQRKPTLASVARQAAKAGIAVARYDFRPDGTISIVVGKPVGNADIDMDDTTASPDPKWK